MGGRLAAAHGGAAGFRAATGTLAQGAGGRRNHGASRGQLPLDLEFPDEDGGTVRLGHYFTGDRPVILTLGYYRCPMLCTLVLNGLVDGLTRPAVDARA